MPAHEASVARPVRTPADIVRLVRHLPSAPRILPPLKRLLRDGNSALVDIVALVRLDPGLSARVLQVANSPFFYTGACCLTVDDAIARVGYDEIYGLISHAVAVQVLNRPLAVYRMGADELWARSVACALAAQMLATRAGDDQAIAYTLGLLHGIGMIAIDEWALHSGYPIALHLADFPDEATADERRHLGFTQADAGAALLQDWDFPREMIEPIREQYLAAPTFVFPRLSSLLVAAKWVRSAVLATVPTERPPIPPARLLRPLGLSPADLRSLVPAVEAELARVRGVLEAADDVFIDRQFFPSQVWRG
ncbi:MAG TPA: HDOD domain-containing protein [Opitutaceae bacterium]|nr:HDOD domain-containing protein [Opitutaceae bacterium]